MEVSEKQKKLYLSPTLLGILVALATSGIPTLAKAQNVNLSTVTTVATVPQQVPYLHKQPKIQQRELENFFNQQALKAQADIPEDNPAEPTETPSRENQAPNNPQPNQSEPRVLVAEVDVVGADEEITDIVYNTIETEPGRTTTRSQLQEDVNAIYATGFFQDVQITPADTPLGVRITFLVKPNPILNQVAVETVPAMR